MTKHAPWWPLFLIDQIPFSFFVEGHMVIISAELFFFIILTIGFRDVLSF